MLVLNEISDDYEEPGHINERVVELGRDCGLSIEPSDVNRALLDLVRFGWAKAYDLWKEPREEVAGSLQLEQIGQHYYWITPDGRHIQSSFKGWPF
jgi:hypothetical protein